MRTTELMTLALDIGELMLTNGAETYRVEDTIIRILATAKGTDLQTFVTPTGIFASLMDADGSNHSFIRRTDVRSIHLSKIEAANDLSRQFCDGNITLDEALEQLSVIQGRSGYSLPVIIGSTSMAAGLFAIVFGGTVFDALITFIAGLVLALFQTLFIGKSISKFFIDLLGGFVTAITALILIRIMNLPVHQDIILISAIMPLVPGVAITNAIRDTLHGHLVSGNARILDAFIVAASIATGVGMALALFDTLVGGVI